MSTEMGQQLGIQAKPHAATRHGSRPSSQEAGQLIREQYSEAGTRRSEGHALRHGKEATEFVKHKRANLG